MQRQAEPAAIDPAGGQQRVENALDGRRRDHQRPAARPRRRHAQEAARSGDDRPALLAARNRQIERDPAIDAAAGQAVPSRSDVAHDTQADSRLAVGGGGEGQGEAAEAGLGRRRETGFDRLIEPQRDDVGARVAAGNAGRHPPAVGQHDLGLVGLRKDLLRRHHDIGAPQGSAAWPGACRADAGDEAPGRSSAARW